MKTVQWVSVILFAAISANASVDGTLTNKAPMDLFLKWKSSVSQEERNLLKQAWGVRTSWTSLYVPGLERVVPEHPRAKAMNIVRGLTGHPSLQYAEQNFRVHRTLNPLESSSVDSTVEQSESEGPVSSSLPNDPMIAQQWAIVGDKGVHPEGAGIALAAPET